MHVKRGVLGALLANFFADAFAAQTQFVDKSSGLGFAVSSVQNQSSTDVSFQIAAPASAGWGAVGTGDRMDGSLMFIIYPSSSSGVTVSLRTAKGHDTPNVISGPEIVVQSSQINNGIMTANVLCYNCTTWTGGKGLHIQSTEQPWIWAIGPAQEEAEQGGSRNKRFKNDDSAIEKHAKYGIFFVDMPKTLSSSSTSSATAPTISGTSNINTTALPGSVAVLIIIHAICLGGAFVLLFPLGVVTLRWFGSVRLHWVLQVAATVICAVGLAVAVTLSAMDPEYKGLDAGHQVIGIVVVAALFAQAALGYVHHVRYKKIQRRTWAAHLHLWTGRALIVVGMLNAAMGFVLAGNSAAAAAVGVVSVLILVGMWLTTWFGAKRAKRKTASATATMDGRRFDQLPLTNYDSPQGGSQEAIYHAGRR